jgi:hypothetical protein
MKDKKDVQKEEVEELDELSKKTLGSYVKKAAGDAVTKAYRAGDVRDKDSGKNYMKALGRQIGISTATSKLAKEEVEELDELKKSTLASYIKKATPDAMDQGVKGMDFKNENRPKHFNKAMGRMMGIKKAADKLAKEEVENLDELKKSTLASYVKKSAGVGDRNSLPNAMRDQMTAANMGDKEWYKDSQRKANMRGMGIQRATDRLAKEEVELDESTIDKNHPIAKEYFDLKKKNLKDLKDMITQRSKISDTSEFRSKEHAASHLIRRIHGDKKVDQVYGFNEEADLDEGKNLTDTKSDWRSDKSATAKNWSHNKLMKVAKHDRSAEKEIKRRIASKEYVFANEEVELNQETQYEIVESYLLENNIDVNSLTEEELNELIGKAIGGAFKLGAKAVVGAARRMSTSGRADAEEKRAAAAEKKNKDRERIRKAQQRLKDAQRAAST